MPFDNLITSFEYDDLPIRIAEKASGPEFVLTDVCRILGHSNPAMAAARLDDDEKGVTTVYTLGGMQELITITESGLYRMILTSRKPQAKAFRKWITSVVLPSIRRYSTYVAPTATVAGVATAASETGNLAVANELISNIFARVPLMGADACQAVASTILAGAGIAIPGPIVAKSWTMTEIAKQSGISAISAGKRCRHLRHENYGSLSLTTANNGKKLVEQFKWNAAGRSACEAVLTMQH